MYKGNCKALNWMMKNKKSLLFLAITFFVLVISVISTSTVLLSQNNDVIAFSLQSSSEISHDPTKLDLPQWVQILMQVFIWVVIAVLSIGILSFTIYIIVYFVKRKFAKTSAYIDEKEEDDGISPNLVRITLGEEATNEESN